MGDSIPGTITQLDILGYDFVQCAVVLQGLKSAVDFLQQLCVSLLYSNGILFIGKGLLQNLQSFCLSNKGLGRLPVDYNRVNLALAQCLNSLKALVVTLYRGAVCFQVRYIDAAGGSKLNATILPARSSGEAISLSSFTITFWDAFA